VIHQGQLLQELSADEMERRRRRWLRVDARDREVAYATLTAAGLVVDTCAKEAKEAHGETGEAGTAGTAGTLHLSGAEAIAHPEEIARRLVAAGADLTRLSVEEEDLESQFLRLVGATPLTPTGDDYVR